MAHVNVYVHLFLWSTLVLVSHSASLPCAGPRKPRGFGSAKHAIIIGIDGLGAIYFRNATQNLSNLDSFMQQGAYSTHSRGVYPTTAMMFTWEWFKNFAVNNTDVDEWFWGKEGITCNETGTETKVECTQRQDSNMLNHTFAYIKKNKPTLTFVQLGNPMLNETLVVVVADHGGWKNRHNFELPFSALVDIPILMRGPGVIKNKSLEEEEVSSLDVAVTILNALGIEKNHFMKGRVLENIYPPLSPLPSPTLSPSLSPSLSPTPSPVKPKCAGSVFISSFSLILLLLAMFILISPF